MLNIDITKLTSDQFEKYHSLVQSLSMESNDYLEASVAAHDEKSRRDKETKELYSRLAPFLTTHYHDMRKRQL